MSEQETVFDFSADVEIDPNALDVEWMRQSSLFYKYGKMLAKARDEMDRAKSNVDLEEAKTSLVVRENPEKYVSEGLKITEGVISSVIESLPNVINAKKEYDSARYEFNLIQAAVSAMDQKKAALENLVRLNGQAYFSSPSVPRDLNKEWENKQKSKQTNEKIKERMNSSERRSKRG